MKKDKDLWLNSEVTECEESEQQQAERFRSPAREWGMRMWII